MSLEDQYDAWVRGLMGGHKYAATPEETSRASEAVQQMQSELDALTSAQKRQKAASAAAETVQKAGRQTAEHGDGLYLVDGLQVVGPRADQAGRRGDDVEDGGTQDAADHLIEHVHATVLAAHASAEIYAERDSGINVAARDSADSVGHCHD